MKSCFDGYLTEECKTCSFWADGRGDSVGCAVPFPIGDCPAFARMADKEEKKARERVDFKDIDVTMTFDAGEGQAQTFHVLDFLGLVYLEQDDPSLDIGPELIKTIHEAGYDFIASERFHAGLTLCKGDCAEGKYSFFSGGSFLYCIDPALANLPKEQYEANVFPKLDKDQLTYKVMSGPEVKEWVNKKMTKSLPVNMTFYTAQNNNSHYVGMHYFYSPYEHMGEKIKYLIAFQDDTIVGVICYGYWGDSDQLELSYIDVAHPYRNQGVATALVKEFANVVKDEPSIRLSGESELGAKCHMHDLFKKHLTIKVITSNY